MGPGVSEARIIFKSISLSGFASLILTPPFPEPNSGSLYCPGPGVSADRSIIYHDEAFFVSRTRLFSTMLLPFAKKNFLFLYVVVILFLLKIINLSIIILLYVVENMINNSVTCKSGGSKQKNQRSDRSKWHNS